MQANWKSGGKGAASGAALGTSILPGWGTAVGAGVGFVAGLFQKKKDPELIKGFNNIAQKGGYFTVPTTGVPGHPEWKPGSRQWIPPNSPFMDNEGKIGGIGAEGSGAAEAAGEGDGLSAAGGKSGIDYDAMRARGIAPTRAVYQNATRNLQRQPGMGVNNPGYGAQMTALSRGLSSDLSDAATNVEGSIANTRLQEIGQQNQYALGKQQMGQQYELGKEGLDIERKKLPSKLDKGLSSASNILGLIGTGAQAYGAMGSPGLSSGGGNSSFSTNPN